jgi:hypothetical protein
MLGVLIALFSGPFAIFVTGFARTVFSAEIPLGPQFAPAPSLAPTTSDVAFAVAILLLAAPFLESLIFPLLYWLTQRLPGHRFLFTALIGIAAYVAHGAMLWNLTQAAGFMLLALWYTHLRERFPSLSPLSPVKIPYAGIVIAHFGWNATAILWPLFIGALLRLIGA